MIALILAAFVMSGCATRQVILPPIDTPQLRTPPQEAMAKCDRPLPLVNGEFGTVIEKLKETIDLLNACSSKRDELSDYIKRELK
jgi:hypothetical protein